MESRAFFTELSVTDVNLGPDLSRARLDQSNVAQPLQPFRPTEDPPATTREYKPPLSSRPMRPLYSARSLSDKPSRYKFAFPARSRPSSATVLQLPTAAWVDDKRTNELDLEEMSSRMTPLERCKIVRALTKSISDATASAELAEGGEVRGERVL